MKDGYVFKVGVLLGLSEEDAGGWSVHSGGLELAPF